MICIPDIPSAVTGKEAYELATLAEGKTVLEIGSLLGFSTIVMAQTAAVVHSVDPHEGYPEHNPRPTLGAFRRNLRQYGVADKVVAHVGLADQVLPCLRARWFDFAFVDLSLTDGTTARAVWWAQHLLRYSGVLAVHDYGHETWPGATQVIRSLERPFRLVDTLAIFDNQVWSR